MQVFAKILFWLFSMLAFVCAALGIYLFFDLAPQAQEWNPSSLEALMIGFLLAGISFMIACGFRMTLAPPAQATMWSKALRWSLLGVALIVAVVTFQILFV